MAAANRNRCSKDVFRDQYYYRRCLEMREKYPRLFFSSPWIRPEDVSYYEAELGVENIKIAGRQLPTEQTITIVEAYSNGEYHGNLLDLLSSPYRLRDAYYIPNDSLDGTLERLVACSRECNSCGYCDIIAARSLEKRAVCES